MRINQLELCAQETKIAHDMRDQIVARSIHHSASEDTDNVLRKRIHLNKGKPNWERNRQTRFLEIKSKYNNFKLFSIVS